MTHMKDTIKRFLPNPILQTASKVICKDETRKDEKRYQPLNNQYKGKVESVLQCCIAYNKYGGYCVPLSSLHRPATQTILSGEVWEPETIDFMIENCGLGDIIHAGTYFGDFIPALARRCSPSSIVWAFEPNPENYRCASITTTINDLQNVEIINAGLGSQKGFMQMLVTDQTGKSLGGSSKLIESTSDSNKQAIQVEILRIDDRIPTDRNISILQLDVEGFEQQALSGSLATIRRCKPILILENLPKEDWLSENILKLGYKVVGKVHVNSILAVS